MLDVVAFFFGNPDAPLFGRLHAPKPADALNVGLVICNPFGFEEVCAHRSLGQLAQMAAGSGIATLRFDYAGCGNSSGSELDPDTLARWLASIHLAVDTLKQRSGVHHVVLLGLRLGASLAALAAAQRSDVCGVVAIAPVVQGRLYLRELRILAETTAGSASGAVGDQSGLESAGFLLTQEATDAIGVVDLRKMALKPAPNVLIVERDDMPVQAHWAEALNALKVNVRVAQWPGYRSMMVDPQSSQVPSEIFDGVISTLKEWAAAEDFHQIQLATLDLGEGPLTNSYVTGGFHERAIRINMDEGALVGVLTTPTGSAISKKGVLLINSGSVHSIGPNRLWVRLARSWAARGIAVLRLDLSGLGDSPARIGRIENVVYSVDAGDDIAVAIRFMREQCQIEECHLLGLCSGAFHGFKAAVKGVPLSSTVLINPLTFFWELGKPLDGIKDYEVVAQASKYKRQLFSMAPWRKLLGGKLDLSYLLAFAARKLETALRSRLEAVARLLHIPLKQDLARELLIASQTGAQHFIFAVGDPGIELLRSQGKRSLARLISEKKVTIDFVPDADHTFTRQEARDRLVVVLDRLMHIEGHLQ